MGEKHRIRIAIAVCLPVVAALSARSQTASGTIQGTVYDPSRTVVGEAHVTLTEQQTNQTALRRPTRTGFSSFAYCRLEFTRWIEKTGFAVESSAPLLQVADTRLSQVIDEQGISELPLHGRNMLHGTERQANYGPGFSVGGQRDNTNVALGTC